MSAFMVTARNRGVEFVIHSGSDRQVQALVLLRKDHAVELLTVLKENREGVINLLYPTRGEVHVKEGEVTGGAVTFNTGGNLTVSPGGINVSPGAGNSNGGQITLEAGATGPGTLLVTGALSANGSGNGTGGTISLVSNSATIFNIGSKAKTNTNGVLGALSASGADGTLYIINEGGGITNAMALNSVSNLTESVGGTGILALGSSLSANKDLQIVSLTTDQGTITKSGTLTTARIILQSTSGNIGTSCTGFSVIAGEVQASATGLVNITDTIKSDVSLDASTAGTSFKLVSSGALIIDGTVTAGTAATLTTSGTNLGIAISGDVIVSSATGTAALTATGKGIISQTGAGGSIQANTLTLKTTSGTIGTPTRALDIDAAVLNLTTTGAINIANLGTATQTVNGSATKGTFDLTSDGSIIIAKAISSATAYSLVTDTGSNGSITVNAAVGGNYATSIIIAADGSGNISSSTSGKLQTKVNGTVTLTSGSGNIGSGTTSKTTLNVYTTNLSTNTGGSGFVNIASKLTSAVAIESSTSGGLFDLYTAGSSALDSIKSSGGGINVTETTGALSVNDASTIHAGNGSITLVNVNKSSGTIVIGNGSQITTMSTGTTGGQVSIVLGPVPTNPAAGTAPSSGLTVNQVSGGNVFYGKGITVLGPVNTINLQGSDVVFNVGTRPITAITLGGGVTITADPVIASAPGSGSGTIILSSNMLSPDLARVVPLTGPTIAAPPLMTQIQSSAVASAAYAGNGVLTNYVAGGVTGASSPLTVSSMTNLASSINAAISDNIVSSNNETFMLAGQNIGYRINEPCWMSDTELQTGEIPAVVFDGDSLGIKNEVSSILELDELNGEEMAVNYQLAPVRSDRPKLNNPLTGCVSTSVTGEKTKIVNLRRGTVIFAPIADTLVCTPLGDVKVSANSVAMIMAFDKGVAIYNLLDRHKDAIVFKTGEMNTSIMPGGVTIICASSVQSFRDINPTQAIGYRNLQSRKLDGNVQTFSGQFSMMQAIGNVMPLRAMVGSKNAHTNKIGSQLLKTAAILDQINGSYYQQVVRPTTAAFLH